MRMWRRVLAGAVLSLGVLGVSMTEAEAAPSRLPIERIASAPYPYGMVAAPSGGAVAWIFNERGARNVWTAERDAGGAWRARRLTAYADDDGMDIQDLRWTGDGRSLVFVRGGDSGGRIAVNPLSLPGGPKAGELWAVAAVGGAPRRLADGYAPAPAPGSDRVVFLRGGQPFVVSAAGGEAQPLFRDRGQVGDLRWSPTGDRLAFTSNRGGHQLIGVFEPAARRVTWMAPGTDEDDFPAWSPDGRRLAFARSAAGDARSQGRNREGVPWQLWTADVSTGEGRRLWTAKPGAGSRFRLLFNSADSLFWTADDQIVFPSEATGWTRLYALPASGGGEPRLLTPGRSEVFAGQLSADRRRVIYAGNEGDLDRRHVWEVGTGGPPRPLSKGDGIEDYPVVTRDGRILAVNGGMRTPLRPVEVTAQGLVDLAPAARPADFPAAQLAEVRLVTFPASDGKTVHGTLFVPPGLTGKAPALVFTHGGPTNRQVFAAWDSFETHSHLYEANQFLATNGYVVLSINYRGGSGYGLDWREAEGFGVNGGAELRDVVGAARYLQGLPEVDPKRLGIWGGSYGGRMTSLAMGAAPEFWVAGVDYAGVHDLAQYYLRGEADPAAIKLARESSAVGHIDTWRAPVLLMAADADALFPQTVELAALLRRRGVAVETLQIPDEVHFLLRHQSWNTIFQATKTYLDRFLKP